MDVPAPLATDADALEASPGIPVQRRSDAFTAYASVHQLGIALQRDRAGEAEGRRPV